MHHNSALTVSALLTITSLSTGPAALAYDEGEWLFRAGVAHVAPNDDSGAIEDRAGNVVVPGSPVEVDSGTAVGLTATYMLRDNIGLELLAATPFKHDLKGAEGLAALDRIGSVEHLPPSLLVQYHFSPQAKAQPYVGIGLNYTTFFSEEASSSLEGALGETKIKLDDSLGLAVQAGIDVQLNNDWFLNAAYWRLNIDTEATLRTQGAGRLEVDVDIDPDVFMLGVGKRF